MKKITDREFKNYEKYEGEKNSGRLITMNLLRIICEANNNVPEAVGKDILNIVRTVGFEK